MNIVLLLGSLLGLTSVMMAAFVDHSLGLLVTPVTHTALLTAVRYHQTYSVIICLLGLFLPMQNNPRLKSWLMRTALIFIVGIVLFSLSIYCAALTNIAGLTYLVPIGGITLMIGWLSLLRTSLLMRR